MDQKSYTLNRETGKIELRFEKSEYLSLPEDKKNILRSNFLFSRSASAWVSRAKYPNLFNAKAAAKELGFTEEIRVGERLSYEEQMQLKSERAEARAERYDEYAEKAAKRGANLQKDLNDRHGDIAFFTQPIIPGHSGSERFAKWRQKLYDRYDRGTEEYRKSEYFRERAATALATAENAKLKDTAYLNNRIKECTSNIKKLRENVEHYEKLLVALQDPQSDVTLSGKYTIDKVSSWLEDMLERMEIEIDKKSYFENCLDAIGGFKFSKDNIKAGYIVKISHGSEYKILKANPKTVYAQCLTTNMILTYDYAEIREIVSAVEEKKEVESHPFKKDEILIWDPHGRNVPIAAYQVLSVTEKSIQLQEIKLDENRVPVANVFMDGSKPIRRKPYISLYSKKWAVCGDMERVLRKY